MRVKKLTMQAFLAFREKTVIDFSKYDIDNGLLLITGPTGSGKSTIFDAICFALYGRTSLESRKVNSLRSDFAKANVLTYVELEFYHNNKLYCVRRSPEYMRKKKRGVGFVREPASAFMEVDSRKLVKPGDVSSYLEDLLGLDYKQFCQISMLSQGEFTKFLMASSEERTSIFRKIFATDIYSNIMLRLKNDCRECEARYNQIKLLLDKEKGKITDLDCKNLTNDDVIDTLNKRLELEKETLGELEIKRNGLHNKKKEMAIYLENVEKMNEKIIKLHDTRECLSKIKNGYSSVCLDREILDYNLNVVPEIKNVRSLLEKDEESVKNLTAKLDDAMLDLKKLEKKISLNKESFERLERYPKLIKKLNDEVNLVRNKLDKIKTYEKKMKIIDDETVRLKEVIACYDASVKEEVLMEEAFYLNEAYLLAENLKEGEACLVCGSVRHPKLAVKPIDSYTKEDINLKRNEVLEYARNKDSIIMHIDTLKEEIDELNLSLEDVRDHGKLYLDRELKIVSDRDKLEEEYNDLSSLKIELTSQKQALLEVIEVYKKELDNLRKNIDIGHQKLEKLYLEYDTNATCYDEKIIDSLRLKKLQKKVQEYDKQVMNYSTTISLLEEEVGDSCVVDVSHEREIALEIDKQYNSIDKKYIDSSAFVLRLEDSIRTIVEYNCKYEEVFKELMMKRRISDTANGALTGHMRMTFENYVQSYYLTNVLREANKRLVKMTDGRYELVKMDNLSLRGKVGLDFSVNDAYTGRVREVSTLSGGEKFTASLALALGLSDVISMYAGGIKVDCLFIDEGFGSLDQDALNQAINTLSDLVDNDKLVGIISHVDELISRIDKKIVVKKKNDGSCLEVINKYAR